MVVRIMEVWVFLAKIIAQKPASQFHPGTLAVLIRYNQAPKVPTLNASNRLLQNFKRNYSMEFSTD